MMRLFKSYRQHVYFTIGVFISFSAISGNVEHDKSTELKLAKEYLRVCISDAKEDEVLDQNLLDYLAICINDELEANGNDSLSYDQIIKLIKRSKLIKLPKLN